MKSQRILGLAILFVVTGVSAGPVASWADAEDGHERQVTLEQLPSAVRTTVLDQASGHDLLELEEVRLGQGTYYEAEWLEGGWEVEILVAADGALLCKSREEPDDEDEDDEDDEDD